MAKTLSKSGIVDNYTVDAWHVSQSIDAFKGTHAYDITISGSLNLTGDTTISGSLNLAGGTTVLGSISCSGAYHKVANDGSDGVIINTARTDDTFQGNLLTDGWGNFVFDRSVGIGWPLPYTGNLGMGDYNRGLYIKGIVGIGTTSPSEQLEISAPLTDATMRLTSVNVFNDSIIKLRQSNNTGMDLLYDGGVDYFYIKDQNNNIRLAVSNTDTGVHTVGYVGIGTINPNEKLEVIGNISSSGLLYISSSESTDIAYKTLMYDTSTGRIYHTGSYGGGGGGGGGGGSRPITSSKVDFVLNSSNTGYYFRTGGGVTCSINANSTTPVDSGAEFDFFQTSSAGYMLFESASGVILNSKNNNLQLAGQFSAATIKKVGTNEWDLIGDLT